MKLFLFSLCAPLLGTFFSPMVAFFVLGTALFFKSGTSLYTFGIPTIIATMCWFIEQRQGLWAHVARLIFNVVLPIGCMLIFIAHPVGMNAFAYSLYWLIPPVFFFMKHENYFINLCFCALRITFIAHAIGSVLWLYMMATTASFWIALIPTVACERFRLALLTVIIVGILKAVERYILHSRGGIVKNAQTITGMQSK